ncbi:MAG: CPBP family intramembrane metalloprotease [Pseudothermotoga sp.]|uniref:CPBP family intramembrane glutamic endopeptidase n=1 Tax=Pseudothermotoga sp. TaxID=2033661 RepID=UPI00199D86E6|nr:CPBP family intramembrane metalloprotease [Pseudothermotoga sp.]
MLKLLEVTIIVAGFFAIQNLSRLFKPGFRLVSLSVAQVCYAVLVYLRNPIFNFSPHLKGFLPFALLFILTLFLGRFLGAAAASVQFRPTVINFLTLGLLLPVSEEVLFRGTLLALFPNAFFNGILFSVFHLFNVFSKFESFSLYNLVYRFAVGFIFASSTLTTKSLFSAISCHVINNCLGILLPWFEHETKKRRHDCGGKEQKQ